jgi:hypothetical protein
LGFSNGVCYALAFIYIVAPRAAFSLVFTRGVCDAAKIKVGFSIKHTPQGVKGAEEQLAHRSTSMRQVKHMQRQAIKPTACAETGLLDINESNL